MQGIMTGTGCSANGFIRLCLYILACLSGAVLPAAAKPWQPAPQTSFEWILQNYAGTVPPADVLDIDLFDATKAQVAKLKAEGKRAICYVSVGSWENWRPDKDKFPAIIIGNNYQGWSGERWLDIRRIALLGPILVARFDLCKAKGFNAIEPDNLDGYANNTGFHITRADQVRFIKWLAAQAHQRGLSIGLKNVPELLPDVISDFDWALVEDCFAQGWCWEMSPFVKAGKAVFSVEYTDNRIDFTKFCTRMKQLKFSPLLKRRELTPWSRRCPS